MTGFLVLACCGVNDVPMGLYATADEAEAAANAATEDKVQGVALSAFSLDAGKLLELKVIEMRGADLPRIVIHINRQ